MTAGVTLNYCTWSALTYTHTRTQTFEAFLGSHLGFNSFHSTTITAYLLNYRFIILCLCVRFKNAGALFLK